MDRRSFLRSLIAATAVSAVPVSALSAFAPPKPTVVPPLMRLEYSDDGVTWKTISTVRSDGAHRHWRVWKLADEDLPKSKGGSWFDGYSSSDRWMGYDFNSPVTIEEIEIRTTLAA